MRNSKKMRPLSIFIAFVFFGINACSQKNDIDNEKINNYIDFLINVELSAKEYILDLFQFYDIVILAERYHTEETQYELINEIVSDEYFISNVGNICVEIGSSNFSDSLNDYLRNFNDNISNGEQKLLEFQRNISFYPLWNRESYRLFLANLLTLNKSLAHQEKINLCLCDREFDWSKIHTKDDWKQAINNNRDSIMAQNISLYYNKIRNSSRNKMLVILNEAHAIPNPEWIDMWQKRAAQYLSEKYGSKTIASVLINTVATNKDDEDILLQEGYWDAAFNITKKINIGFDFINSPFGQDKFDYAIGKNNDLFCYKDIFTGFVFYKPIEQHQLSTGVNGIIDDDFKLEFLRRINIYNGNSYYRRLRKDKELLGWNKLEYYHYDNFDKMVSKINRLTEKYTETETKN